MSNDNNKPVLIFKAELIGSKVVTECFSKHVPTLAYIESIIQAEKLKLIINEKAREERKNAPRIHLPDSLRDFLRRK